MKSPGGLCGRHSLYSMDTTLIFQPTESALAFNLKDYFLKATEFSLVAINDVHLPVFALGIATVHAEEVSGEKGSLFTACTSSDFHDNIFILVNIFG